MLQDAVDVRERLATSHISAHGGAIARRHLLSRLHDLVAAARTVPDRDPLAAHLTTELPAIFGFLFDRTLDGHELASRAGAAPAVVNRVSASCYEVLNC